MLELTIVFKGGETVVNVESIGKVKSAIMNALMNETEYSGMLLGETAYGSATLEVVNVGPMATFLFEVQRLTWSGEPRLKVVW